MVTRDTLPPFKRFMGATAKMTRVVTLVMEPLMAVPIPTMVSRGIPYSLEKAGSRYTALNMVPNTVMQNVPAALEIIAFFFVFLNI